MRILTAYGEQDRALVERSRIIVDNEHERTLNLEYRLKAPLRLPDGRIVLPDEVIKRSAHVRLKQWPDGLDGRLSRIFYGDGRSAGGVTPTGSEPGAARRARLLAQFRFANSQAMCTQFKVDILNGLHAFGVSVIRAATTKDSFKAALYLASASRGAADTVYSTTGELAGTGNYTQGGIAVTNATVPAATGTTAFWTPSASLSWAALTSSGSFDAMGLYNDTSATDLMVAIFTFGAQSIVAGTFTLTMPTNDATTGLLRLA